MKEEFDLILEHVCMTLGLKQDAVLSKSREGLLPAARSAIIFWFKSIYPACSWKDLGRLMMGMDHSSVMSAFEKMDQDIYKLKHRLPGIGKSLDHQHFHCMNLTYDVKPRYRLVG